MIILSLLILLAFFFSPVFVKKKLEIFSPSFFMFIVHIFPFVLGALFYFFLGSFEKNIEVEYLFFLICAITSIVYVVSYIIFYNSQKFINPFRILIIDTSSPISPKSILLILNILVLLYIIIYLTLVYLTSINPIINPLEFRVKSSHDFGSIYASFQFMPVYFVIYSYYYMHIVRSKFSYVYYKIILIFSLITMFFSGSRGMVIEIILTAIIMRYIFEGITLSFLQKIILLISILVFVIIYPIYRVSETLDIYVLITVFGDVSFNNFSLWEFLLRYDSVVNLYKFLIKINAGEIEYIYGQSIFDAITIFVPRWIYGEKPLMYTVELHKILQREYLGGALDFNSNYMMAEAFANLHLIGVFIYSMIWGNFVAVLDRVFNTIKKYPNLALGFILFYIPILTSISFPQSGFNSMGFQQVLISYFLAVFQVSILRKIN